MPTTRVRITDVARAAGVSVTTVSDALNGKGRLPDKTRKRVQDTAAALGYRPNGTARSLASGRTGLLALAVSSPPGMPHLIGQVDYFMRLMSAATTEALDRGYALILAPPSPRADAWQRVGPDGAIIVDPLPDDPLLLYLEAEGIPLVTTGRDPSGDRGHTWVDNDHKAGARAVFEHFARRGAERIALLSSEPIHSYIVDISTAYEEWCRTHDAEPIIVTAPGMPSQGAGYDAALPLLRSPNRPDAIYATLDRLALGVVRAAADEKINVPRELLVAGCSDSEASRRATPALTVLNLHPDQIARAAVDALLDVLDGHTPEPGVVVPSRVVARGSTRVQSA